MKRNTKILMMLMAGINVLLFYILHFNAIDVYPSRDHYQIYQMIIKNNIFFDRRKPQDTSQDGENVRKLLRKETEIDGYFPVDGSNVCPYLGIRKIPYSKRNKFSSNNYCKSRIPPQEECIKAHESYRTRKKSDACQDEQNKAVKICSITHGPTTVHSEVRVKCDLSLCGNNSVFVANIDPTNGELEDKTKWKEFFRVKELERILPLIITENIQNGFHFCFLHCLSASGKKTIKTLLIFPPRMRKKNGDTNSLFNINVLVLDSVSRPHFYRSLPKTVKTLREITYSDSLNATVLDYELFQSLGPYTYINMKAFFTGNSLYHAEKSLQIYQNYQYYYGFDVFYRKLKEKGFYTLLQEDLCWHDVWGTVLANTRKDLSTDRSPKERIERWRQLLQVIHNSQIDDTGISHATCNVLQQYNVTSHFTKPKKVCYGNKIFFQYFLDYLEKLFSKNDGLDEEHEHSPIFAYTHFNIGHEYTGIRIKQADEGLSKYLKKLAEDQNTLTLIFSDHGPKVTDYSIHSLEGLYELYTPFLFMIMPEKIARIIGEVRIKNLIENQKRLITLKDVNGALTSILEYDIPAEKPIIPLKREGIFSEIPEFREICVKSSEALCICNGTERWLPNNFVNFTWIAEFAIGELNNRIQQLHSKGMRSMSTIGGFGKCQRLVKKVFKRIRMTQDNKNFFVTMDITVSPVSEIFQVIVKYPKMTASLKHIYKRKTPFARLLKFRRLTTYQYYYDCKDAHVSIQLCVCKRTNFQSAKERAKSHMWKWTLMNTPKAVHEVMRRHGNLGANHNIQDLDARCLFLITRSYGNQTLVYEIGNTCTDRRYIVRIIGQSLSKIQTSVSLPLTVDAKPLTLQFVLTVYHHRKPFDFKPSISFHILSD